jgi:hypothetical protein
VRKVTRSTGEAATIAKQETAVVTIKAIDARFRRHRPHRRRPHPSFKVETRRTDGVSVGDKVEITFTTAVMISVK